MRIVHTADWHIGQTLNGWTREAEHRAFLRQLPDLVAAHEADVLVVAGDVFDGINPSAESLTMLYEALVAIRAARPHLTTVIIAGNHDPAGRLEAPAVLLRMHGVHVVGTIHRRGEGLDLDRHLVPLTDAGGAVRAHALAIPFLRAADLPGVAEDDADAAGSPVVRATRRLYAEAVEAARAAVGDGPLLATGHLHCSGGSLSEGAERRILVGGEHAVPHDVFPSDLAYVALGHLHRPQAVGRGEVRYSGSLFPLSATELPYEHGVTVVDLCPAGARTDHVRLSRAVPCIRLPEAGAVTLSGLPAALSALRLDPACPDDLRPFVHVVLEPEGPAGSLALEAERLMEGQPLRCAGIRVERPATAAAEADATPPTRLDDCLPVDLFERAFLDCHAVPPGPEHRAAYLAAEAEA
jgi:exonuclease SbcD